MAVVSGINRQSYEQVRELIKPALDDPKRGGLRLNRVVGSHGTQVDSIRRLAVQGYFSGGKADNQGAFQLTPNVRYMSWPKTKFNKEISEIRQWYSGSSIDASVEYAETLSASQLDLNNYPEDQIVVDGVVITFNKLVIGSIRLIDKDELLDKPEIVLKSAPSIETIYGIYPVDREAAEALHKSLPAIS